MPGAYPPNLKEGSRSEILADYLFSAWGAVTPVRRQDDFGLDLYCTLSDRIGQRAVVRDYFTVQVKSVIEPWVFDDQEQVRWLVEYPTPLYLACVDKAKGSVAVYHVMPRYCVWAFGKLPSRLELTPENTEDGKMFDWENGQAFSLSAPIIQATCTDLTNDDRMETLRKGFQEWVGFDRENCDLVRQGLLRFRMPESYRTNQIPDSGINEVGNAVPEQEFLNRGILRLTESAECIGGQLFRLGNRPGALRALLLVNHLLKTYPQVFKEQPRWTGTIPGDLGNRVCRSLNDAVDDKEGSRYVTRGLDEVEKALEKNPLVKKFLMNR